jgi:hypothetical protein
MGREPRVKFPLNIALVKTFYLYSRLKSQRTEMYVIVYALEPVLKLALSFFLTKLSLKSSGVSHAQGLWYK